MQLLIFVVLNSVQLLMAADDNAPDLAQTLWYREAANPAKWEQALPLGNGRLGGMVFGGIESERIIHNEDSLWSGWSEPNNDREGSYEALKKIRKLIKSKGDYNQIKAIAMNEFCSLYGYGKPDFGAYQSFCDSKLNFQYPGGELVNYQRRLELENAIATVTFKHGDTNYTREYFCSYPDQVMVMRFRCDKPGKLNFTLGANSLHKKYKVEAGKNELKLSGQVETGNKDHPGVKFEALWKVSAEGGEIVANEKSSQLEIRNANSATIIMSGATNYKLEYPHYKSELPERQNRRILENIQKLSYDQLRSRHVADYQELYNRVDLKLGKPTHAELPINERLGNYKKAKDDRALEALLFQYGRYLMIASSRPGSLPANLQGLWNNTNKPAWNADYHLNINMQMNYWPVDSCNLSECFEPVIKWTEDITKPGAQTAKIHYNARGWTVHHTANVWGFTSPGPKRGVHMLEAESAAFLCQNIWDHYAFTQDKDYLEKEAWPILKGAVEFWVDNLQEVEGGYLAVSPSYSPEHGPLNDGTYYQTMIIWDLFTNYIEATKILNTDKEFANQLIELRKQLQPLRIGEYGQLQEWRDPALEKKANKDKHRHISHMYALHPGKQIIPGRDEALTKAATQTLKFRGDGATGWSMGWKINFWARLLDGDHAHKLIQNLIAGKLYDNLWDAHPPFQIDGNFGYTAGVAEMLLQSHADYINLLPALPSKWQNGSVKGLCARSGYIVDLTWKNSQLETATIHSKQTAECRIKYKNKSIKLALKNGERVKLNANLEILQRK